MPSVVVHSGAHQFPAVAASGSKYIWAHFGGNRIVNIESIYKLQAAQLVTLKLDNNNIVKVKALRKAHFPLLHQLDLQSNPITDIDTLSSCAFGVLASLVLEDYGGERIGEDIAWLSKIESGLLQEVGLAGAHRIRQPGVLQQVQDVFKGLFVEIDSMRSGSDSSFSLME